MYNFVANSCIGAWYYELIQQKYNNPFVWTAIEWEYFFNLYSNIDELDYGNIKIEHDDTWLFQLIIDDCVRVNYNHHIFDPTAITMTKQDHDLHYCKIWEVIVDNYVKRIKRMLVNKYTNIFMLEYNDKYKPNDSLLLKFVNFQSPYKLIVFLPYHIHPEFPIHYTDKILIIRDERINDGKTANKVFSYAHRDMILSFINS